MSDAWTVPATTLLEVEHGGRPWRVTVAQPVPAAAPGALSPVVYVLDPFGTLGTTVHVARTTHLLSGGLLPGLLVVGVGPATDDVAELVRLRSLDLTPGPPDAATEVAGFEYGGVESFLSFLCDVVAPLVEPRFGGDPSDRTLAGWSLGGLAGVAALLGRPTDFRRYLLVSPSLWWGSDELLHRPPPAAPGALDVYLAVGELEETTQDRRWPPVPAPSDAQMVTNVRTFAERLGDLAAVTVHVDVLAGEHHTTVWPAAVSRGLLALHASSYTLEGSRP